jgi:hypothetical protein
MIPSNIYQNQYIGQPPLLLIQEPFSPVIDISLPLPTPLSATKNNSGGDDDDDDDDDDCFRYPVVATIINNKKVKIAAGFVPMLKDEGLRTNHAD